MRRRLSALLASVVCVCALVRAPAEAIAAEKVPTIVLLTSGGATTGGASPYQAAAEGFRNARAPALEIVVDPDSDQEALMKQVRAAHPDVLAAIGDPAAHFANQHFAELPRVTALAPSEGSGSGGAPVVQITSDASPATQIYWIGVVLPDVKSVGIIYDPTSSQALVDAFVSAAASAKNKGRTPKLSVVPIPVKTEKEILAAFQEKRASLQALLFVPDKTTTTYGALHLLLKASIDSRLPTIGFNSRFISNGSVLAFDPDYRALGKQAADATAHVLDEKSPAVDPPASPIVWVNTIVVDKLGLRTGYDPDTVKEFRR